MIYYGQEEIGLTKLDSGLTRLDSKHLASKHIDLKEKIRNIPDFPKPGILFRDITTLLQDPGAFRYCIDKLTEHFKGKDVDSVAAIEARGYMLGAPLAYHLGVGFIPVRKPGKLPWKTIKEEYSLEYGTNVLELHEDAIKKGSRVAIIDDLIATGGSSLATKKLIERLGGQVVGFAFIVELLDLKGRELLRGHEVFSLVQY